MNAIPKPVPKTQSHAYHLTHCQQAHGFPFRPRQLWRELDTSRLEDAQREGDQGALRLICDGAAVLHGGNAHFVFLPLDAPDNRVGLNWYFPVFKLLAEVLHQPAVAFRDAEGAMSFNFFICLGGSDEGMNANSLRISGMKSRDVSERPLARLRREMLSFPRQKIGERLVGSIAIQAAQQLVHFREEIAGRQFAF